MKNMDDILDDSEKWEKFKLELEHKTIVSIRKYLDECDYQYYTLSNSIISDYEYDMIMADLDKLQFDYNKKVGYEHFESHVGSSIQKRTKFSKVKHNKPMLSLSNSYSIEDIVKWICQIKKILEDNKKNRRY